MRRSGTHTYLADVSDRYIEPIACVVGAMPVPAYHPQAGHLGPTAEEEEPR